MTKTTFAQRFEFARLYQALHGRREGDKDFAESIGVVPGSVTGYKALTAPPPFERVLAIAKRCGVDPGWLAFGAETAAPEPEGFSLWLERQVKPMRTALFKRVPKSGEEAKRGKGDAK